MRLLPSAALAATLVTLTTGPARAGDVIFTGALLNSCVLNVSTPGVLGASTDGLTLSSELGTGTPAVVAVVAVGAAPTLSFTAPTVTVPAAHTGTTTTSIRYQALGGANQAYTTAASSMSGGPLLDTVTINSRVQSASGFKSGTYTVKTTVTCQQ